MANKASAARAIDLGFGISALVPYSVPEEGVHEVHQTRIGRRIPLLVSDRLRTMEAHLFRPERMGLKLTDERYDHG